MSNNADWRTALRRRGESALASYPDLAHEWQEDAGNTTLRFPARSDDGFDVELSASASGILFGAGGFHTHFDEPDNMERQVIDALGLARDLLSTGMRLRELRAGGLPYRWILELATVTGWQTNQVTGLLFWNYLGRRSEAIFQNRQLPARFP
jgi:hypothetical protein